MASRAVAKLDRRRAIIVTMTVLVLAGACWILQHRYVRSLQGRGSEGPTLVSDQAPAPTPWTAPQLQDLLTIVRASAAEGLRPTDYDVDQLESAVRNGATGARVNELADATAITLAHDFAAGRIRNRHRFNWYIDFAGPDAAQLAAMVRAAREKGELKPWLAGLLPINPEYRALRGALATTPEHDGRRRDRIKANLERWRWLPRDFGTGDQLYINLPTYEVSLIRGGQIADTYKAVIGATDMPTPVLSSPVRQVIANPDWIVPMSIVRKSHLRPSSRYVFSTRPDGGLRVRQKPGPGNALGRVKIEFPNKLAIYFHDTPSRSLFGADARTFSHGCVRVENIDQLAAAIVARPERLAKALAGTNTRSLPLAGPLQANIVYLTLVASVGGGLVDVGDPYELDEPLAAALSGRKAVKATASPPVVSARAKPGISSHPAPPASEKIREHAIDHVAPAPPANATPAPPVDPPADAPTPSALPTAQIDQNQP